MGAETRLGCRGDGSESPLWLGRKRRYEQEEGSDGKTGTRARFMMNSGFGLTDGCNGGWLASGRLGLPKAESDGRIQADEVVAEGN